MAKPNTFDIVLYDTIECEIVTVWRDVPGENEDDACRKVAKQEELIPIKAEYGTMFGLYRKTFLAWDRFTKGDDDARIAEITKQIEDGDVDGAPGLYQLYETNIINKQWGEPCSPTAT